MYVTEKMIRQMERQYGVPSRATFTVDVAEKEYDRIHSSQTHGRNHDVTLYIRKDDSYVVIAKPFYPAGLYRAPSGGLKPGEDFHVGIRREINEEAGVEIKLDCFILRTEVDFRCDTRRINWRSFVFTADYISGDFKYTDHEEIAEVRLASLTEFDTFGKIMRRSDIGGLYYRAALHETVAKLI